MLSVLAVSGWVGGGGGGLFDDIVLVDGLNDGAEFGLDARQRHLTELVLRIPGATDRLGYLALQVRNALELVRQVAYLFVCNFQFKMSNLQKKVRRDR